MQTGDTLGAWTLADLQISYSEDNNIHILDALFTGEVTLTGTLSRSALENRFDFYVAKQDEAKMPCYIAPEMAPKDMIVFMPNISAELAAELALGEDEQRECQIVISDYRFIFAYTMAPASATLVSIEDMPGA